METTRIWLDTDIGNDIDDTLALAYLLRQKRCDLVGVSTVTGPVDDRCRIARAIMASVGRDDVPLYAGHSAPLSGPGQPTCPQAEALTEAERGVRFETDTGKLRAALMAEASRAPGELTLLTIGPLTNVAHWFEAEPELPKLLKEVVTMAGVFRREDPAAEWNALCDPEATRALAEAPVSVGWVPLDVTLQCIMDAEACRAAFTGELLQTVLRFAEVWFRKRDRICFHDPLAAVLVFEPEFCQWETGGVEVHTEGEHPGATHFNAGKGDDRVAVGVRSDLFFEHYFHVVHGK